MKGKRYSEEQIIRICSQPPFTGPVYAMRVDPHSAWDRTYTRVAINACPTGTRQVYIADLSGLVS